MPTREKRFVLHTESSTGFGGQEIRVLAETGWLLEHGWRALIAAQPGSRLLAEAERQRLPAVVVPMRRAVDPAAVLALRRIMKQRGVSLVHTHSSVDSWLGAFAARSLRLPVVRSRHVSIPIRRRGALVYRLADRIVTSGERVRDLVIQAGIAPEKVVAVTHGVDTRRFHPGVSGKRVRDELGLTGPVVGLVANVRGSKGHQFFLEAAREVLLVVPACRFLLVGDGVGYEDVRRRVRDLDLEREVVMTGFRRDIPEVMAALDVLVLPSVRSEATSQVIPQALAVGTPVVASTAGGSPELVRDGETGRLVPPGDSHALAEAILSLLREPEGARKMAQAGQAAIAAHFTLDASMAATTAVYETLLARRS